MMMKKTTEVRDDELLIISINKCDEEGLGKENLLKFCCLNKERAKVLQLCFAYKPIKV